MCSGFHGDRAHRQVYRADTVVLLGDGKPDSKPVLGIIVEVQLSRKERKRFTSAAYMTLLRARIGATEPAHLDDAPAGGVAGRLNWGPATSSRLWSWLRRRCRSSATRRPPGAPRNWPC
jgi:hypothetical protein